jgi:hypothetical protein
MEQEKFKRDRKEGEKTAAESLRENQRQQDALRKTAAATSGRIGQGDLRKRIAEAAMSATASGTAGAKGKADLAEALGERREALIRRNLMTPDERREAKREDQRRERAARKADRQINKEAAKDIKEAAPKSDPSVLEPAINEVTGAVNSLNGTVKDRLKFASN